MEKKKVEEANAAKKAAYDAKYQQDLATAKAIAKDKNTVLDKKHFDDNYGKGEKFALRGAQGIIANQFQGQKGPELGNAKEIAKELANASRQKLADVYDSGEGLAGSTIQSYKNVKRKLQ